MKKQVCQQKKPSTVISPMKTSTRRNINLLRLYGTQWDVKHLGDYHDIYLYQDIFLLADIFEQFRHVCLKNYGLDPAHYHTAPGLAWDASRKITGVKLQTLKDKEMHLFFEEGMRGGISMISNCYLKANNPYLPDFDPDLPLLTLFIWMLIIFMAG